jgi:tetratricopeptide (TPR) repeat protein
LGDLIFFLFALLLFSLSADLVAWGWPAAQMARIWLLVGGIVALLLWAQVLVWFQQWQAASAGSQFPPIIYRLPVPNLIAIFLNPFILAAAAFFLAARGWMERAAMVLVGMLFVGLSYLASSRASWLGLAVGLVFLLVWFVRSHNPDWRAIWAWLRARWALMLVLGLVLLAGLAVGGWLLYQQTIHPTHAAVGDARQEYWPPAWEAFLKSPLVGHGPYTFGSIWLETYSVPPKGFFPHAHSTLFNLLAEGGLLLTLAFAWLWWNALRLLWHRLRTAAPTQAPVVAAGLAGLLAFTVQGFFDCYHHEPLGLWALLILLGMALGIPANSQPPIEDPRSSFMYRKPWWVLGLLLALWLNLWTLDPMARGERLADAGEWSQAVPLLQEAAARDPWGAVSWVQAGLAQAYVGDLSQAVENFEKASALDPDWSLNWANLGALYLTQGDTLDARSAFKRAADQDSGVAEYWLGLGQAAEAGGDGTAATEAYGHTLSLRPDWTAAYFWRSSELRRSASEAWLSSREATPAATIEQLEDVLASDPSRAGAYVRLGEAYLRAGRWEDGERILQQAELAYFNDIRDRTEMLWLRAEVAAQRDDLVQAIGFGEQALSGLIHPGLFGPDSPGGIVYFPIAFRRPSMRADYVPQYRLILMTDAWGERMVQLAQWYAASGQPERAQEIYFLVLQEIPDQPSAIQYFGK